MYSFVSGSTLSDSGPTLLEQVSSMLGHIFYLDSTKEKINMLYTDGTSHDSSSKKIVVHTSKEEEIVNMREELTQIKKLLEKYNAHFDSELLEIWDNEEDDIWDTY